MCRKTLKQLAVAILGLPASSAATERSFSTYAFIHSTKRNRLTVKRAGMLMYVAHNTKLFSGGNETKNKGMLSAINMPGPSSIPPANNLQRMETESGTEADTSDEYSVLDTNSSIGEEIFSDFVLESE